MPQTLECAPFEAIVYPTPGVTFVLLAGDLDIASAPKLIEAVEQELGHTAADVVFDLAALEFADVAGARALVRAVDRVRSAGGLAAVISPSRPVERVVRLLGIDAHVGLEAPPGRPPPSTPGCHSPEDGGARAGARGSHPRDALRAVRRAGWHQTISDRVRDVKDAIKEALAGSR